jgi:hypothetical protein
MSDTEKVLYGLYAFLFLAATALLVYSKLIDVPRRPRAHTHR